VGPRQHLIATAATLLAAEGVQAVTLRGIAKAAGVSHGAPLRHFPGRAQLLSAVATLGFLKLREHGEQLPDASARERLLAACHGYLDFALDNPAMFELMFRHDLIDAEDPELSTANSAVFDFFADLIAEVQAEGWRADTDPRLLAASLWASLHGLAGLWLWGGLSNASFAESIEVPLMVTLDSYFGAFSSV
jgi:AcrR family transcriptional regulator